jgi:hypothetical protein
LVRQAGFTERCIITSLNQAGLARVRQLAPEIRIGQIVTVAVGDVTKLDVDLLSMSLDQVTPARVRANRKAGLATHVWTVNQPADMARMLDYGVDNIITDEPAKLKRPDRGARQAQRHRVAAARPRPAVERLNHVYTHHTTSRRDALCRPDPGYRARRR